MGELVRRAQLPSRIAPYEAQPKSAQYGHSLLRPTWPADQRVNHDAFYDKYAQRSTLWRHDVCHRGPGRATCGYNLGLLVADTALLSAKVYDPRGLERR